MKRRSKNNRVPPAPKLLGAEERRNFLGMIELWRLFRPLPLEAEGDELNGP